MADHLPFTRNHTRPGSSRVWAGQGAGESRLIIVPLSALGLPASPSASRRASVRQAPGNVLQAGILVALPTLGTSYGDI